MVILTASQNRVRFDAERRRLEDIYKYSAEVSQILSSVDPRLEQLERDLFTNPQQPAVPPVIHTTIPASVPVTTAISTVPLAITAPPAAAAVRPASPARNYERTPAGEAYFIA